MCLKQLDLQILRKFICYFTQKCVIISEIDIFVNFYEKCVIICKIYT